MADDQTAGRLVRLQSNVTRRDAPESGRGSERMHWSCAACGRETDTCYTDSGTLGMVHGQCLCRACYVADGHPECHHCGALADPRWQFCAHCGRGLMEKE